MLKSNSKLAYGIDFGTTNSTVAVVDSFSKIRTLQIDPQSDNTSILRSIVYVSPKMDFLFGKAAIEAYLTDVALGKGSKRKVIDTGRMIKISSPSSLTGGFVPDKWVPEIIEIEEAQGGRLLQALKSALTNETMSTFNLFGKKIPIEEIIGKFIREMKVRADEIVGENVEKVIIGRPVRYVGGEDTLPLERMTKALKIAGFKEINFEYEPVGAALDFGIDVKDKKKILVFDFGGGTLDISIFEFPSRKSLVNLGLPIGGDYFNSELFAAKIGKYFGSENTYGLAKLKLPSYIFESLGNWYLISLLKNEDFTKAINNFKFMASDIDAINALQSLVNNNLGFGVYEELDRLKKKLSSENFETYNFVADAIKISEKIAREEFEDIIKADLVEIKRLLERSLAEAKLETQDIDVVFATGGSSLIPVVQKLLEDMFGKEKIKSRDTFTSVAAGLAIRAKEFYSE